MRCFVHKSKGTKAKVVYDLKILRLASWQEKVKNEKCGKEKGQTDAYNSL